MKKDGASTYRLEKYNADLFNELNRPNKLRDAISDDTFTANALELPSGSLVNVDRDLLEITEALLNSRPDLPTEYFTAPGGADSIQYLEEQFNRKKQRLDQQASSDSSFRTVFEKESGFFNQSEAFQMYLAPPKNTSLDPMDVINKAVTSRRGEDYRRRQTEAMEKLQQTMAEIEKMSVSKSGWRRKSSPSEICSSCGCRLSRDEIIAAKQVEGKRVCRECYVEKKEFKNGSPYLIGRVPNLSLDPIDDQSNEIKQTNDGSSQAKQWRELFISSQNQLSIPQSTSPASTLSSSPSETNMNSYQSFNNGSERPTSRSTVDRIKSLEHELENYKRRAENAENEVVVLKNIITDLQEKLQTQDAGSYEDPDEEQPIRYDVNEDEYWVSTEDPDTGEIFRWNKYTGQIEW